MTNFDPSPRRSSAEDGSAYLATLLVLVVLTLLGLSLAVITQTEVFIGTSEKQAVRQVYAAGSGAQAATVYELVSRDSASHRIRIAQRTENVLGQATVIGDDVCTSPLIQVDVNECNLCDLNEDKFKAVQYAVSVTAMRRGDATLGAKKEIGSVFTVEPWQANPTALQVAGDEPLKTPDDPTLDVDASTETDPCEGMFLKI